MLVRPLLLYGKTRMTPSIDKAKGKSQKKKGKRGKPPLNSRSLPFTFYLLRSAFCLLPSLDGWHLLFLMGRHDFLRQEPSPSSQ
jgi:hypothetical protein